MTDAPRRPGHSRQASIQDHTTLPIRSSPTLVKPPVNYTVIIRLPFNRNDFVDPAPVEWDSVKDKALWKLISKGSDMRNLDWEDIAARFDVSLAFLMKQAAWLYERHFAGVRKQMQRLATVSTPSSTPSIKLQEDKLPPLDTADSLLKRRGSKKSQPQSPRPRESPVLARPEAPPFSRTPSAATITQSRLVTSARQSFQRPLRTSATKVVSPKLQQLELSDSLEEQPRRVRKSASEEDSILARSQAFRRPPLSSKPTLGGLSSEGDVDDDDDDEDEESSSAGFLPFAARQDPQATLRGEPQRGKLKRETTSSSTSSASQPPTDNSRDVLAGPKPGPLSPQHRAKLRQLSPRSAKKDGSDGTPSMGSSFSDLDDAGISASALEDAVLSNMQAGGASIASRVSGLSQAFRRQK